MGGFYQDDVSIIKTLLLEDFREVEDQRIVPDDVWKFGYEAHHLICLFPRKIRKKFSPHIDYFELQICTLFQHAWSQANHGSLFAYPTEGSLARTFCNNPILLLRKGLLDF